MNTIYQQIAALSLDEKMKLVEDLWDSIAQEVENLPVPAWQLEELERRKARFQAHPTSGKPWSEVKRDLGEKYGRGNSAT
ncbi:MAG: addiction module protein [Gemmataceae bacterium]|mgnify:CR=1 FL=1